MRNSSSLDWLRFMHTPNDYRVSPNHFSNDSFVDDAYKSIMPEFRYDQRVTRSRKEKRREFFNFLRFSTQTRGRTGMEVNPLVFETSASTDSAIWAHT